MFRGDLPFEGFERGRARVRVGSDDPILKVLAVEPENLVELSAQTTLANFRFGVTVWWSLMPSWAERRLVPICSSGRVRYDFPCLLVFASLLVPAG